MRASSIGLPFPIAEIVRLAELYSEGESEVTREPIRIFIVVLSMGSFFDAGKVLRLIQKELSSIFPESTTVERSAHMHETFASYSIGFSRDVKVNEFFF